MLAFQYLLVCDLLKGLARKVDIERRQMCREHTDIPGFGIENLLGNLGETVSMMKEGIVTMKGVVTKKYKPVAKKVKPVIVNLLGQYRIIREIQGDPLENMPVLEKVPHHSNQWEDTWQKEGRFWSRSTRISYGKRRSD